jgi:hypothetical protein
VYFVIAARPNNGLPPVALAGAGSLQAAPVLAVIGALGLLPFTATFGDVALFGTPVVWWVPLLIVAVVGTALACASGITASGILGSRVASFIALLEVVSASIFAWLLVGEALSPLELLGGLLILAGDRVGARGTAAGRPVAAPAIVCRAGPPIAPAGPPRFRSDGVAAPELVTAAVAGVEPHSLALAAVHAHIAARTLIDQVERTLVDSPLAGARST